MSDSSTINQQESATFQEKTMETRGVVSKMGEWIGKRGFVDKATDWVLKTTMNVGDYFTKRIDDGVKRLDASLEKENKVFVEKTAKNKDDFRKAHEVLYGAGSLSDATLDEKMNGFWAVQQDKKVLRRKVEIVEERQRQILEMRGLLSSPMQEIKKKLEKSIGLKSLRAQILFEVLSDKKKEIEQQSNKLINPRSEIIAERKIIEKELDATPNQAERATLEKKYKVKLLDLRKREERLSGRLQKRAELLRKLEDEMGVLRTQIDEYDAVLKKIR